jgi:ASPM-SPD-2-Hydin domain-containing protein/HYDIN/CFA65/VesB family protein
MEYGVTDLTLDASAHIYVTGSGAAGLPFVNPIQTHAPTQESTSYVAEINPATPSIVFSSNIGGAQATELDQPTGVGADSSGNIYAAGIASCNSNNPCIAPLFPVFNALQSEPGGLSLCSTGPPCSTSDGFFLKIVPTNAPAAALSPAALTFTPQMVDTASPAQTVTVIDLGSAALTVSNVAVTGDFAITNGCATVAAAGGTCAINVTFTPTAAGTRTGTLTITDNSVGSPRTLQLTGAGGLAAATLSASSLTFAAQPLGTTSSAQQITVTNGGAVALLISHIQASGDFSENNNCGTSLSAGGSCTINVLYAPTSAGAGTGTLTITDNASNSPQAVALTGTGTAATIGLGLPAGGSSSATVTAGQTAKYTLAIGGAGMSGTATLSCSGAPTGANCSVPATVTLNPTTASTFTVMVATIARAGGMSYQRWYPRGFQPVPWLWAMALMGVLALFRTATRQRTRWSRLRFAPLLAIVVCACGGGSSTQPSTGTQAGTYTVTVTATAGSSSQSQKLTLKVN